MKRTTLLAAISFTIAASIHAQEYFDLDNRNRNLVAKKTCWSQENNDNTDNIHIEITNKAKHAISYITFEIVADDKRGTRLELGEGYSKRLFSNKILLPNTTGDYYFSNIAQTARPPARIQISNIYAKYEDGSVENIRLEIK